MDSQTNCIDHLEMKRLCNLLLREVRGKVLDYVPMYVVKKRRATPNPKSAALLMHVLPGGRTTQI